MGQAIAPAEASTVIEGLDDILAGGFARRRVFLVGVGPGGGKTTTALSFLPAGAAKGETSLNSAPMIEPPA
jgi:circadian clock protein KaiC